MCQLPSWPTSKHKINPLPSYSASITCSAAMLAGQAVHSRGDRLVNVIWIIIIIITLLSAGMMGKLLCTSAKLCHVFTRQLICIIYICHSHVALSVSCGIWKWTFITLTLTKKSLTPIHLTKTWKYINTDWVFRNKQEKINFTLILNDTFFQTYILLRKHWWGFLMCACLQEFLRSIPGSLLCCELHEEWMDVLEEEEEEEEQVQDILR